MFDIHKRRGLAPPTVSWDILPAGFRGDHQGRRALAHRAAHPTACCDHHITFSIALQCLSLHFYLPCSIIKTCSKVKNY